MKGNLKKAAALLMALVLCASMIAGCGKKADETTAAPAESTTAAAESTTAAETSGSTDGKEVPLVIGTSQFSQKFSPFYADTAYDMDIVDMVFQALVTTDRLGGVIMNSIEGETVNYNGTDYTYQGITDITVDRDEAADTTTYTVKLRDDLKFSDGEPLTADDVIFTYYVFLDPAYVGSTTANSYDIVGLQDYVTQTTSEIYDKYKAIVDPLYEAGIDHKWSSSDAWTEEMQTWFWDTVKQNWAAHVQMIVDSMVGDYLDDDNAAAALGLKAADIEKDDNMKVAFGMAMYGFASLNDAGMLVGTGAGTEWDVKNGKAPTIEEAAAEVMAQYDNDPVTYYDTETLGNGEADVLGTSKDAFISNFAASEPELENGIPNIAGIVKVDDYTVQITMNGFAAPAIYNLLGIPVAPLHYYGDPAQYDYENNKFGHPYGDLSVVEAKTTQPVGSGPYKFVEYKDKVVYLEANENYCFGQPKIKYVQYKEIVANEVAAGVKNGTVDMGEMTGSVERFDEVQGYNSNGEITGDVITTTKVDNLGYGYIGLNADTMNVAGEASSDASKSLRKGFATLLSVYRDTSIDSYYGEAASVINYPISNTSWAAPQPTDADYQQAFSVDVDGNPIYTADMTPDQKYEAALQAAIGFFKAAGYTFDEASGKFTAAPEGAKMSYEALIPGDGTGDHPSFAILTDASQALASIGLELKVNDLAQSTVLWERLDAGTQEIWCAAWQATIDPDMFQTYHSSGIIGQGGSDSNHYHLADPALDELLVDARGSDDQSYRKSVYKQCLDIIIDWAVEVPAYQRQNCVIFSTDRINMDTMTPDITTFYEWWAEVENLEMN